MKASFFTCCDNNQNKIIFIYSFKTIIILIYIQQTTTNNMHQKVTMNHQHTCHTSVVISDLAKLLQKQVELEHQQQQQQQQQRIPHHTNEMRQSRVEIVGMDVLMQALAADDEGDNDSADSCFSSDSVRQARKGNKRRCQFRNRQNIGNHYMGLNDSAGEFSTDSVELAKRHLQKSKQQRGSSHEHQDSVEEDVLNDEIPLVKELMKHLPPSGFGVASPDAPSMQAIRYGNAAA